MAPQICPSIINNRVSLNFLIFGFVLSPFRSHRYHPIELIKVQDFSYSFSLGVSHLWLSYSPRQSHLDHTHNAFLSWSIGDFTFLPLEMWHELSCHNFETIQNYYQWGNFKLLPLSAWLYHTKTRLLLNSCMGVHFSSFHFKNSSNSSLCIVLYL
jgi:hypothetical protein